MTSPHSAQIGDLVTRLMALEGLARAATPGPWSLDKSQHDIIDLLDSHDRTTTVSAYRHHEPEVGIFGDPEGAENDMAYIAACSPETILALTNVVRAAQAHIKANEGVLVGRDGRERYTMESMKADHAIVDALASLRARLTQDQGEVK